MEGVLAATDPRLSAANLIYIGYCTSDAYAGNITADEQEFGFNFLGRDVVTAVWRDLVAWGGLGSTPGTRVLYSGCSAGARGVMFGLDYTRDLIGGLVGSNLARFGGLLDSAFYVDLEPFDAALPSLMDITRAAYDMARMADTAMPACAGAYPGADAWRCFFGQYALPFVASPFFLNSFLYDQYQLMKDGIPGKPSGAAAVAYEESFRNLTSFYARREVVPGAGGADVAAMLPACHLHCSTQKAARWSELTVGGVTTEAAVAAWYFGDGAAAGVPAFLEDTCDGYNCGEGCTA